MAQGELVGAIAMTEPAAGSDLQGIKTTARRDGDDYVINGSKTFITNGWHASLICVAVKTDTTRDAGMKGISLVMVETKNLPGYRVGRHLEKVGMHGQDTCELFFDDVRVPAANLLGLAEGHGFYQMMEHLPYERLTIGVGAVAMMEQAVAITTKYAKERARVRQAADGISEHALQAGRVQDRSSHRPRLPRRLHRALIAGQLDPATAAMAKYWLTDSQCRVVDECVQLHGGYGYMMEYPIARMWADSRVQRIYAGTNEIMKELIARSL